MKILEKKLLLLGTEITLTVHIDEESVHKSGAESALEAAANIFHRIHASYTRFSGDSELSQLNRQSGRKVEVSEELYNTVKFQLQLAKDSNGKFDPTIIDLLELSGYSNSFNAKDIAKTQESGEYLVKLKKRLQNRPHWSEISIIVEEDHANGSNPRYFIQLAKTQRLDLGSVGKGLAIDLAALELASATPNYLISAGGDIWASGINLQKNQPWTSELRVLDPVTSTLKSLGNVEMSHEFPALASSGSWARSAGNFHHLLNPKSGMPKAQTWQVFVLAKSAMVADGLATALFLTEKKFFEGLCKSYKAEALVFYRNQKIFCTENFPLK